MASGTLYVFFHGLSVMWEKDDRIEVVLPQVPGHVFKAGTFLAEASISSESPLSLEGVTAGSASFSQTNFTINLPDCSLRNKRRAATLLLDRPKSILGFRLAADPQGEFVVTRNDTSAGWKKVAIVPVLTYDYQDENDLALKNHYNWEPSSCGGATSLHIISTSEGPEGDEHDQQTQNVLRKVLGGYPGVTFKKPITPTDWRDTKSPNYLAGPAPSPGAAPSFKAKGEHLVTGQNEFAFAQAELEDFRGRLTRLGRLGRMKRAAQTIEGLWRDPDPLGEEVSNCIAYTNVP